MKVAIIDCFNPIETKQLLDNYSREGVVLTRLSHNICLALKRVKLEPILFYACKEKAPRRIHNGDYYIFLIPAGRIPLLSTLFFAVRLFKELRKERVAFVFLRNINTCTVNSILLSRIYPVVGLPAYPQFSPAFNHLKLVYRLALSMMKAIVVQNETLLKQLTNEFRISKERLIRYNFHTIQPIFGSMPRFGDNEANPAKSIGFRVAVYAGNFGATVREPQEIVKAMKIVKSRKISMECHIFGLNGSAMQIMKQLVSESQVEDVVKLYGRMPYEFVLALLSESSLAVNPLKISNPYEGMFSLEALSSGVPLIVYSPENSLVEMKGAYLVPKNSDAIASLLCNLYDNKELLLKKSSEAKEISKSFSIDVTGKKLLEIVQLVLREKIPNNLPM